MTSLRFAPFSFANRRCRIPDLAMTLNNQNINVKRVRREKGRRLSVSYFFCSRLSAVSDATSMTRIVSS